MKRIISTAFLALSLFTAAPSFGHGDHAPPGSISESELLNRAVEELILVVDASKKVGDQTLDTSWKDVKAAAVYQKGPGYYIVSLKHPSQEKTLYLLMSDVGESYDANFTGVFAGLSNIKREPIESTMP